MTLERGYLLNKRYRIVEILGQGGMAAVYRAIDENLGVEVAVKENLFTTEEYARQFRREAVILANLRHPNLPRVTDHFVIEQQGQYLVMDYIEGEDLRQRMDRLGPLPDQEVIILGAAICDALTYLHTRRPSVLHRDIKPGNVKITPQGQIFLVDFGLAKVVQGRQATTTGARAMTPGYSPPEQYGTARTDQRTDIYSLGATLYSALTDAVPEDGLARAMDQAVLTPLLKRNPKISRRLANTIEKALAVRPEDRYQSAEEFKNDLLQSRPTSQRSLPFPLMVEPPPTFEREKERESSGQAIPAEEQPEETGLMALPVSTSMNIPISAPAAGKRGRTSRLWLSLLIVFILLASAAGTIIFYPALLGDFLPSFLRNIPVLSAVTSPTVTPSTQLIALSTQKPANTKAVQTLILATATPTDTVETMAIVLPTATETIVPTAEPTMTPIGGGVGEIAFVSDRSGIPEIYIIRLDGSGLRRITDTGVGACQPDWSPDGTRLVFVSPCEKNKERYDGAALFVINVDGTGLAPLLPPVPGGDYEPAWSPDGKKIAFTSLRNSDIPQIHVLNLEDGSISVLPENPARTNSSPSWSPDSKQIAFNGPNFQIRIMDANGGNRFLLARNVSQYKNVDPVWSPLGLAVVFTQYSSDLTMPYLMAVSVSPDGGLPSKIPNSDYSMEADFSPDGFWLTFTNFLNINRDIYIMSINGLGKQQITFDPANDFDPAWRPNAP